MRALFYKSLRRVPEPTHHSVARAPEGLPEVNAEQDEHDGADDGAQSHAAADDDEAQDPTVGRDHTHGAAVDQRHAHHVREGDDEQDDDEGGHGEGGDHIHPAGGLARAATRPVPGKQSRRRLTGRALPGSFDAEEVGRLQDYALAGLRFLRRT